MENLLGEPKKLRKIREGNVHIVLMQTCFFVLVCFPDILEQCNFHFENLSHFLAVDWKAYGSRRFLQEL